MSQIPVKSTKLIRKQKENCLKSKEIDNEESNKIKSLAPPTKTTAVKPTKHPGAKTCESIPTWQNQLRGPNESHKPKDTKQPSKTSREPFKKRVNNETGDAVSKSIKTQTGCKTGCVPVKEQIAKPVNRVAQVRKTYSETKKDLQDKFVQLEHELSDTQSHLDSSNQRACRLEGDLETAQSRLASVEQSWGEIEKENLHLKSKLDSYMDKLERLGLDPVTQEQIAIDEDTLKEDMAEAAKQAEYLRQQLEQYKQDNSATIKLMQELRDGLLVSEASTITSIPSTPT